MKAWSLLLLRFGTGMLLVLWGLVRLTAPEAGPGLAATYYGGLASAQSFQMAFGGAQVTLGTLCILGLWRNGSYLGQALVLVGGALAIGKYLVDPLGVWLLAPEDSQLLFFPSVTVAAATLVLLAFIDDDRLSLDQVLAARRSKALAP